MPNSSYPMQEGFIMSYDLIKFFYEEGVFDLKDVMKYVDSKEITEEEFHTITGYSYKGLKNGG